MSPHESIRSRLYVVTALLLLLPAGVVFQMGAIHLADGGELRARGERQASSFIEMPAVRGSIYDRTGRALAVSTARYEVAVDPTVPGFDAKADELYALLARATGQSAAHFRRLVRDKTSPQYVLLVRSLDEAAKVELDAADVPGLLLKGSVARRYNYGPLASHLLGHVDADLAGIAGLEQQYDAHLRGEPGRQAVQRDRRGIVKPVVGGAVVAPEHGQHLVLTIDLVRQAILEEELAAGVEAAGARWGTAVAMDPRTGAILALANVPDYDPNHAGGVAEAARRNHAVTDRIEPGSTFKLVTAVAALETGTISPEDSVDTGPGWAVLRGRTMRDSHAYGRISFGEAIAVSSNIAMAKTALEMEPDDLYRYARALGFGSPSWVDLPGEVTGRLKRPEEFGRLTLPWMSTGYEVEATPLQILTAYAALANGGLLVQPYVVAARRDAHGQTVWQARQDSVRRAFSEETAARLTPYFERVVSEDGTARRAAVEGLRIAGKTGTAQTATGGVYARSYRATFVGFFPVEAPEVAMIVVLDGPQNGYYGGSVSAPIFGAVARRWIGTFPTIAAHVAPTAPLPARTAAPVPDVDGMPAGLASGLLLAGGFPAQFDEDAAWAAVVQQEPAPGTRAPVHYPVRLVAAPADAPARDPSRSPTVPAGAPAEAVMPDLRGLAARRAVAWLAALGVEARLAGSGAVAAQTPAAGAALPAQAVLTLR